MPLSGGEVVPETRGSGGLRIRPSTERFSATLATAARAAVCLRLAETLDSANPLAMMDSQRWPEHRAEHAKRLPQNRALDVSPAVGFFLRQD